MFAWRLVLLVTTVVAAAVLNPQPDTWWNLRAGQEIWRTRAVSMTEHWSFTAAGAWWPNHESGWQVLAWPVFDLGGMGLLTLVNVGVVMAALLASGPGRPAARVDVVVLMCAIPLISSSWGLRPQVASLACFAALCWLLRRQLWWPIPLLMLVWANLHGSVFLGGVGLVAACLAAVGDRPRLRPLVMVTAASAVATLATPMGWRLWQFVVESIGRSKTNQVMEWASAFQVSALAVAFWVWLLGFAAVVWRRRGRLRDWPARVSVAVGIAMALLAVAAVRNIAFFVLVAMTAATLLLTSDPVGSEHSKPADATDDDRVPAARRILVAVAAVVAAATIATALSARPSWTPISTAAVAAVDRCPGNLYTSYESGSYLLWWAPSTPVFVDNRQDPYPARILELGRLDSTSDYLTIFSEFNVECAAVLATDVSTLARLEADGWHLKYADRDWAVLIAP